MTPQWLMDMNEIQCVGCQKIEDDYGKDHHEDYLCDECKKASGHFERQAS
jgi:hypothetical protein